ncbi:polysaccharide deacetylase [Streptomyces sp. TLI_235]|nr:polysaccharide deacetylase [Streptomyces sp. TLI_235]
MCSSRNCTSRPLIVIRYLRKDDVSRAHSFVTPIHAHAIFIADRGHHIANHTWSHPDLRGIPDAKVRDELLRTSDLLGTTTGRTPTWFRAPGGDWSDASLRICAELGMRPMGWSVDPQDWARPGTSLITQRVLQTIGPGSIVLNHDGGGDRSQTIAALRTYLPVLLDEGYRFTAPK